MYVQAAIEVTSRANGKLPIQLLNEAYRASDCGVNVLVLNNVSASAVDRVLDDVVKLLPLSIPGVLYVDASNEAALARSLEAADAIFVATSAMRRFIHNRNIASKAILPTRQALDWLSHRRPRIAAYRHASAMFEHMNDFRSAGQQVHATPQPIIAAVPA